MTYVPPREQRAQRYRKRIAVAFGTSYPLMATGLTSNVSARGLAMATVSLQPPGTRLLLELRVPGRQPVRAHGRVAWQARGSVALGLQSTMGVQLDHADEAWYRLLQEATGPDDRAPRPPTARAIVPEPPANLPRPAPTPSAAVDAAVGAARLKRFDTALPIRFGPDGVLRHAGTVQNLSATGLAFRAKDALPSGTRLFFGVDLGEGVTARGEALVVWAREAGHDFDIGARLSGVDEAWYRLVLRMSA